MNYMGDSLWWNNRFKSRDLCVMKWEKRLEKDIHFFRSKRKILDVACGDGRNAIYLSKLGFEVFAIDFSIEAIKRLKYFAQKESLNIKTALVDLSQEKIGNINESYDVIIINHYRVRPELYSELIKYLNPDGILWVNGFRDIPKGNPNVKQSDLLCDEDFFALKECNLLNKKIYESENG